MTDDAGAVGPDDFSFVQPDRKADAEIARLIGRCLTLAARKLGIDGGLEMGVEVLCSTVVERAQGGKLDPAEYRLAWTLITNH